MSQLPQCELDYQSPYWQVHILRSDPIPVYNVKKKMAKEADRLGFAPGEEVVAACITFPAGHKLPAIG